MCHESQHGGCCAAGSPSSASPRARHSSSSLCSTTPRATSRGSSRHTCGTISGSPARPSRKLRRALSSAASFRSTSLVGRGSRRGGALCERGRQMPGHRASRLRRRCPIHGASLRGGRCPVIGPEGIDTHAGRSAVSMRALPSARRSLRSLMVSRLLICQVDRSSHCWRAACGPSFPPAGGGGGRSDETTATRKVTSTRWLRLRRLPAPLAGDEKPSRTTRSRLAVGTRNGDAWGLPARPQVQAREAFARGAGRRA